MTFVVSLLRGAAYDWYRHYETRTGCPGDWTTLRRAMLERFGTSIRAEKARAGIYQLRQGNMTVLQYADTFESYLAQIDDYDEAQYLVHFIFGLRPGNNAFGLYAAANILTGSKEYGRKTRIDAFGYIRAVSAYNESKRRPKPSTVAPRRGDLAGTNQSKTCKSVLSCRRR